MKRFAIIDYGAAAEVFRVIDANPRELTAKHVRVSLKTFAINPYDIALRQGEMKNVRQLKFPYVLGNDGAGVVTEVGSEVTNVGIGDEVIVHPVGGTYGEEIVLPDHKLIRKPSVMSWELAASLPTIGITAYHLLFSLLKIKPEQTILVQGASGGVGSMLLQLAKHAGNPVLATASSRNKALVRSLSPDAFGAYDKEDIGKLFQEQADIVIDATKGSRSFASGEQALKPGGIYVALNELPPEEKRTKPGTYLQYAPKKEYSDTEALHALVQAFQTVDLQVQIAEVLSFELSSVIAAHERMAGHPVAGKIIVKR